MSLIMSARGIAEETRQQVSPLVIEGKLLVEKGELEKAIEVLSKAIQEDSQSAAAYWLRAFAYQEMAADSWEATSFNRSQNSSEKILAMIEFAIADYDAALGLEPRNAEIHLAKAKLLQLWYLRSRQNYDALSLTHLNDAIQYGRKDSSTVASAYALRGKVYYGLMLYSEIHTKDEGLDKRNDIGLSSEEIKKRQEVYGDYREKTIADCTVVIESSASPNDRWDALINRGRIYSDMGRDQEAIEDFSEMLLIADSGYTYHSMPLSFRAQLYHKTKNYRGVIKDLVELEIYYMKKSDGIMGQKLSWIDMEMLANAYAKVGNFEEAASCEMIAIKRLPEGYDVKRSEMKSLVEEYEASKTK